MNYQISEAEFNALSAARGQLGLVCGLLTATGANADLYNASDLYEFLAAQADTIKGVLAGADDRYKLQREAPGTMEYFDWMHALRIARGDTSRTPNGADQRITKRLTQAAAVDENMKLVLRAWHEVLAYSQILPETQEAPAPDNIIMPDMLADLVRAASGVDIGAGRMTEIADRLEAIPNCVEVLDAYYAAIQLHSPKTPDAQDTPAKKPGTRKREKLVPANAATAGSPA